MSLNKIIIAFIIVLALFAAILYFQVSKNAVPKVKVTVDKEVFMSEVEKTPEQLQKGLSDRNSLPQEQGMLFIFSKPGVYAFWMKDMKCFLLKTIKL